MKSFTLGVLIFGALATITPAYAATVTYSYTAEKTFQTGVTLGGPARPLFDVDVVTGTLIFESSTPDTNADPSIGTYLTGILTIDESMSTIVFDSISVRNNVMSLGSEIDSFFGGVSSPTGSLGFFLSDSTATAFSSDSLTDLMLALTSFDMAGIVGDDTGFDGNFLGAVDFDITELTLVSVSDVPLPGALLLFASGLGGVSFMRRRRKFA